MRSSGAGVVAGPDEQVDRNESSRAAGSDSCPGDGTVTDPVGHDAAGNSRLLAAAGDLGRRGFEPWLRDGPSRIRAGGTKAGKARRWLRGRSDPELAVAACWSPSVAGIRAFGDAAIAAVEAALQDGHGIPCWQSPGPVPCRTYLFAFQGHEVALDLHHQGLIDLFGINELVPVPLGPATGTWRVPLTDAGSLPTIPPGLRALFPDAWTPVDGTPRFREHGCVGPCWPWWASTDQGAAAAVPMGSEPNRIATVTEFIAPHPSCPHVCDLLIEVDPEDETRIDISLDAARWVVRRLRGLEVPDSQIRVRYSGNRSVYVEVGWRAFAESPRADARLAMAAVAEQLFGETVAFDRKIYRPRQKVRIAGTLHSGSHRRCTPIQPSLLDGISPADLVARSQNHPDWYPPPPSEDCVVDALAGIYRRILHDRLAAGPPEPVGPSASRRSGPRRRRDRTEDPSRVRRLARRILCREPGHPACIQALVQGACTGPGHRNDVTIAIVAYVLTRQLGWRETDDLVRTVAPCIGSSDLDRAGMQEALVSLLASARGDPDRYVFQGQSCGTLRAAGLRCPSDCRVRSLWRPPGGTGHRRRPEALPPLSGIPAPVVPGADAVAGLVDEHRRKIAETVANRHSGVELVLAASGIGKTTIAKQEVRQLGSADPTRRALLWLAERHTLLDDVTADWPDLVHVQPRSASNCPRFDRDVAPLIKAGWGESVARLVCAPCPHNPRNCPPVPPPCPYLLARNGIGSNLACVHQLATLTDVAARVDQILVDEDLLRACVRTRRYGADGLRLVREQVRARDPAASPALSRVIDRLLGARPVVESAAGAALARLLGLDEAEGFLADLQMLQATELRWEGPPDRRAPAVAPNPRPLLEALVHLVHGKAAPIRLERQGWIAGWLERPQFHGRPVLCLDATADPDLLRIVLGREVRVTRLDVPFISPVRQLTDGLYPRRSLFQSVAGGTEQVRARTARRLLGIVADQARACDGRTLLVTYKKLADLCRTDTEYRA
ncbi:MAG: hypothetical protein JXB32_14735, partial [Deltaproteobacteria bacterium]|nr:hypothetical protein [Deltaproteobacteria bacterium]